MNKSTTSSLFLGVLTSLTKMASQYAPAVVLNATDILGKLLAESHCHVSDSVNNDGRFNHFSVRLQRYRLNNATTNVKLAEVPFIEKAGIEVDVWCVMMQRPC